LLNQRSSKPLPAISRRQLETCVQYLRELLSEGSIREQKSFIRSFVKRITIEDGKVIITYTYPLSGGQSSSEGGGILDEVLGSDQFSTPGRTRTCYPLLRRQMLYPDELRGHNRYFYRQQK
jgi:hypothetical protein